MIVKSSRRVEDIKCRMLNIDGYVFFWHHDDNDLKMNKLHKIIFVVKIVINQ